MNMTSDEFYDHVEKLWPNRQWEFQDIRADVCSATSGPFLILYNVEDDGRILYTFQGDHQTEIKTHHAYMFFYLTEVFCVHTRNP